MSVKPLALGAALMADYMTWASGDIPNFQAVTDAYLGDVSKRIDIDTENRSFVDAQGR